MRVSERLSIAIKLLHGIKVGVTDPDDDDGAGVFRQLINQILGLRHIMDRSIGQQEQDLVHLLILCRNEQVEKFLKEWCEQGWTTEPDLTLGLAICSNDLLNAIDVWHGHVTIHGKAMADTIDSHVSRDATKAKDRELFVRVIGLNHLPNVKYGALVLIVRA